MSETAIQSLPGVTLDPKDEAGLESAFGVTSNAEELVKTNRARYSTAHRAALVKGVNPELSERVQKREEFDPEKSQYGAASGAVEAQVGDHLGHEVLTAVVRGSGRAAVISYTYVGDRGSIEKGIVPFVEVFGSAKQRKAAAADQDPAEAGQAAADETLADADAEAQEAIRQAQEDAAAKVREAQEEAQRILAEAHEEAAKVRADAAEQAPADAEKAEEAAAKKQAAAAKKAASSSKRSG